MSCKHCGNFLIKLSVKCYDNITVSSEDPRLVDYTNNNLGFIYDGKVLELSYCSQCSKVDGIFPIVVKDFEKIESPTVYIGEMIKKFYDYVMLGDTSTAEKIMRQLSVRMSPTDFSILAELWAHYESIKRVCQAYPEFDDCAKAFIKRYEKYQF